MPVKIPVKTAKKKADLLVFNQLYSRIHDLVAMCDENGVSGCRIKIDGYILDDPTNADDWELWLDYHEGDNPGWYVELNGFEHWHSLVYSVSKFGEFFGVDNES